MYQFSLLEKVKSKIKKRGYVKLFLDAGDFTCLAGCFALMQEILHAWHESVEIGVQAETHAQCVGVDSLKGESHHASISNFETFHDMILTISIFYRPC